jgi:hypothetical protein
MLNIAPRARRNVEHRYVLVVCKSPNLLSSPRSHLRQRRLLICYEAQGSGYETCTDVFWGNSIGPSLPPCLLQPLRTSEEPLDLPVFFPHALQVQPFGCAFFMVHCTFACVARYLALRSSLRSTGPSWLDTR